MLKEIYDLVFLKYKIFEISEITGITMSNIKNLLK
jgi:hypothetical protein